MPITKDDAAYYYVKEANLREELNALKQEQRLARIGQEHPAWFLLTSSLMIMVAIFHWSTENWFGMVLFVGLALAHLYLAHDRWQKQRNRPSDTPT